MKKLITILLVTFVVSVKAQDNTLRPLSDCPPVDTLKFISQYLASVDYYLPEFINDRGKKMFLKQNQIYFGVGVGQNTLKAHGDLRPDGSYEPVNRYMVYARGSASINRVNFGLSIGTSAVTFDFSYRVK